MDLPTFSPRPLHELYIAGPGQGCFVVKFLTDTKLDSCAHLALFNVHTPVGRYIQISGQAFPDTSFTKDEPLLLCYIGDIVYVPANTVATCEPVHVFTEDMTDMIGKLYVGKRIAYKGGCIALTNNEKQEEQAPQASNEEAKAINQAKEIRR